MSIQSKWITRIGWPRNLLLVLASSTIALSQVPVNAFAESYQVYVPGSIRYDSGGLKPRLHKIWWARCIPNADPILPGTCEPVSIDVGNPPASNCLSDAAPIVDGNTVMFRRTWDEANCNLRDLGNVTFAPSPTGSEAGAPCIIKSLWRARDSDGNSLGTNHWARDVEIGLARCDLAVPGKQCNCKNDGTDATITFTLDPKY